MSSAVFSFAALTRALPEPETYEQQLAKLQAKLEEKSAEERRAAQERAAVEREIEKMMAERGPPGAGTSAS
jgi:hypothetical protein